MLLSTLVESVRNTIMNDSRMRNKNKQKFLSNDNKPFPTKWQELVLLDFQQLDVLLRLSMRPANKVDFIATLRKNVRYWEPPDFKAGILNFPQQYNSYQHFTEDVRLIYTWMAFVDEPEYDKSLLPDVDGGGKEHSLVKTFREMLPESSKHFFTLMPKPEGRYWKDFIPFLDAMDKTWHEQFAAYRDHVTPFINMFHGPQQQHNGGHLKKLSDYFAEDDDILDGDPIVISQAELEQLQRSELELNSLKSDLNALYAFPADGHKSSQKPEPLPCFQKLFKGSCPNQATCKFVHDEAFLRQKALGMEKDLKKQGYLRAMEHEEET